MFGKLFRVQFTPFELSPDTLTAHKLEFACPECRRVLSKHGLQVNRVLHSFRLDGTFVETTHEGTR